MPPKKEAKKQQPKKEDSKANKNESIEKKGAGDKSPKKDVAKDAKKEGKDGKKDSKDTGKDAKKDSKDAGKDAKKDGKDVKKDAKDGKDGKKDAGRDKKDGKNKKQQAQPAKSPKGGKKGDKSPPPLQKSKSKEKIAPVKPKTEQDIIKDSGLLEAYELFLRAICKHGLPTGDVYEFAAQQIEKYEKKKRAKQLKMKAEMEIRKAARKRQEQRNKLQHAEHQQ